MTSDKNALKAGLFIVTSIALGVVVLIAIKGAGSLLVSRHDITASFDLTENLGGLKIGDPVRVGGYEEGTVKDIQFQAGAVESKPQFRVVFTLPTKYVLHTDAIVQIEQGLTGTSNLNITSFGKNAVLKEGELLDGQGSALTQLFEIGPEAKGLIADVRTKVDPAYKAYEKLTSTGTEALANVRDILGDSKTDIRGSIANINATTGTLKDRLPKTMDRADLFLDKTTETIESAKGSLEDIRSASANLKDATAEARSVLVRNRSKIDSIIASLRGTSTNLEFASAEIRRSPWRLLYQPKADEVANLSLYDTTRAFAEAATHLDDTATALRDASQDKNTSTEQYEALMKELNLSFEKYKSVEDKLWESVKSR